MTISEWPTALDLEQRIARGESLPMAWFREPEVYQRELRTVFRRGWQYAGTADRVSQPGSYFTSWIAQTPVVVTRDSAGVLRAFANVCPHRGHAVADGEGCRGTLQCPYHGWTFGLNGALRGAPRTDEDPTFDRSDVSLCEFAVDTWGPLVFVCADPALSFAEATAGIREAAARRGFDPDSYPRRASRAFSEIQLEGDARQQHRVLPLRHDSPIVRDGLPRRPRALPDGDLRADGSPPGADEARSVGRSSTGLSSLLRMAELHARRSRREYFYVYHYRTIRPDRTLQVNDYFSPPDWTSEQMNEEMEEILVMMGENWASLQSCQQGIESGVFDSGIVLPHEEALLCHFQTMHARVLKL